MTAFTVAAGIAAYLAVAISTAVVVGKAFARRATRVKLPTDNGWTNLLDRASRSA
jgi:hypothetical protein